MILAYDIMQSVRCSDAWLKLHVTAKNMFGFYTSDKLNILCNIHDSSGTELKDWQVISYLFSNKSIEFFKIQ